jgi:hypothetical protein
MGRGAARFNLSFCGLWRSEYNRRREGQLSGLELLDKALGMIMLGGLLISILSLRNETSS